MNLDHYRNVLQAMDGKASLLIVSKYHSVPEIMEYYNLGITHFGENRMQELLEKKEKLPQDIRWHFLGHLQKDKVKKVVPIVAMIQSLDSFELADKIEQVSAKIGKIMPCLIELHLADDGGKKTGLAKEELLPLMEHCQNLPHLDIQGIMVMGPNVEDEQAIRRTFQEGYSLFRMLQSRYGEEKIRVYSAGMSSDFRIALEEGSTQIRIGSYLF